jgi:hypothetical protein
MALASSNHDKGFVENFRQRPKRSSKVSNFSLKYLTKIALEVIMILKGKPT